MNHWSVRQMQGKPKQKTEQDQRRAPDRCSCSLKPPSGKSQESQDSSQYSGPVSSYVVGPFRQERRVWLDFELAGQCQKLGYWDSPTLYSVSGTEYTPFTSCDTKVNHRAADSLLARLCTLP
jgi:hypothetical protein